ncbi:hypothetical protein [Burkholderia phage BCSR5]|nr:hypothetical protein [Burkholderia phage BCSR5]
MPVRNRSNNRLLPANARATDVAERAIQEILPVQQMRYHNAFRVQGIECVMYSRMRQGHPCSCQSSGKHVNARLNKEGKASLGTINEMLTDSLEFSITNYGQSTERRMFGVDTGQTSPFAPVNKNQGVFDVIGNEGMAQSRTSDEKDFADNGPFDPTTLDDLVGEFDSFRAGFGDASCPICFGTGYIGGYQVYQGHRTVYGVDDVVLPATASIDMTARPFKALTSGFKVRTVLPRGALTLDVFRVMNGNKIVPTRFSIDGVILKNPLQVLKLCDGLPHIIEAVFDAEFTHFEFQANVSKESTYFEFPRLSSSSDTAVLDQTNPFQIIMSPLVPSVLPLDIIQESMRGKMLIVMNVNDWNTRSRNVLGWECEVRVLQPMELQQLLPRRKPQLYTNQTTTMVRDNVRGPRRA